MKNIIRALDSRIKTYYLNNFEKTKYGKALKKLSHKYEGERCFIIGNGPSLRPEDLDKLQNEYTFAFNRIYYIFDKTNWRPTFYCTQDEKIIKKSYTEIKSRIETSYKFVPINIKWYNKINLNTKYYFSPLMSSDKNIPPIFSDNIPQHIGMGNTVAYTAIQLAVYMGFREIYLLGVDHSFAIYMDRDGNIIKDDKVKDYFCSEYNHDKNDLDIPQLDISTLSYLSARDYMKSHSFKIYNATRGGKLEVFPRVDFDFLF